LELYVLAGPIHNNEYKRADIVINTRQQSSSDLTDFYMWLDKNGKINWISNINETTYQKYKGTDLRNPISYVELIIKFMMITLCRDNVT